MHKIVVYLPAFNEEDVIENTIHEIQTVIGKNSWDILVIDDGSVDNTVAIANKNEVIVIKHGVNRGVGEAFHTAVDYALQNKYDVLVSIDADGQFNPNEIRKLIDPIQNNLVDFSLGIRFMNGQPKHMSTIKFYGNKWVNTIISSISKQKLLDVSCGFRAYSREALLNLNLHGTFTYTHETVLDLLNKKMRVAQIPITVTYFKDRKSRVAGNILTYAHRTLRIILKCYKDYAPFAFFGRISLVLLVISIISGLIPFYNWLKTGNISPYKSLGFIALAVLGTSLLILVFALLADGLNRIRMNQEKMLYLHKSKFYDEQNGKY